MDAYIVRHSGVSQSIICQGRTSTSLFTNYMYLKDLRKELMKNPAYRREHYFYKWFRPYTYIEPIRFKLRSKGILPPLKD